MTPPLDKSAKGAISTLITLCVLGASLVGCSSSDAHPQVSEVANPVKEAPGIMIKFELNGATHTVLGHPDISFCNRESGSFLFSASDPQHDAGAGFEYKRDGTTLVNTYVAADFAVQFTGNGEIEATKHSDGTFVYSLTEAKGHAAVVARDPGSKLAVSDFDLQKGDFVEATASLLLSCKPD